MASKKPAAKAVKPVAPSIISTDLHVRGDLISTGDIHIDGEVDGDVRSVRVTIGETAAVNGSVFADEVHVSGAVNGEISAKSVVLTKTAAVKGDVNHESLSIEAGAFIQGLCKRVQMDSPPPGPATGGGDADDKGEAGAKAA